MPKSQARYTVRETYKEDLFFCPDAGCMCGSIEQGNDCVESVDLNNTCEQSVENVDAQTQCDTVLSDRMNNDNPINPDPKPKPKPKPTPKPTPTPEPKLSCTIL